jgi:putative colanic acid biosynthesis acetyltransferase WcaF
MAEQDLSKFRNTHYRPGSVLIRILWYLASLVFINTFVPWPYGLKTVILRIFGAKVGRGLVIKPYVKIKYPWFVNIGNHVWIGENVWIDNLAEVLIDSNVCISQGAMLLTGNHNYKREGFDLILGSIRLEKGTWLGAKSVVCPGVTVGSHAVLTVGSVATNDLDPYGIYTGNPAERIKNREIVEG